LALEKNVFQLIELNQFLNSDKSRLTFVPPKPNEFFKTSLFTIEVFSDSVKTFPETIFNKFSSRLSSADSRFRVGGIRPSFKAKAAKAVSADPQAPIWKKHSS
jgi:hypothetical protein